jgi:hypothetical protein
MSKPLYSANKGRRVWDRLLRLMMTAKKGKLNMKFGKTYTNKLVSFVDRQFTYESKGMKREGTNTYFEFAGYDFERRVSVHIKRNSCGIFVQVRKDGKNVICEILHTYSEVENFKRMIRCLG